MQNDHPLAPEEIAILDLLIEEKAARERVPIPQRALISRSEKYAFPVGLDERGNPFLLPPRREFEEEG